MLQLPVIWNKLGVALVCNALRHRNTGQGRVRALWPCNYEHKEYPMNSIIYLVGLVVVVLAILSLLGIR